MSQFRTAGEPAEGRPGAQARELACEGPGKTWDARWTRGRDREEASRRGDEMSRARDLDRFYDVLERLRLKLGGCRCLGACGGRGGEGWRWPSQGVYFFFEPGEMREDGRTPRAVRVGTHAVSEGSKTTLWQRLSQHKGYERGRYAGGGNHRGSVFRLHVGTALLATGDYPQEVRSTWGKGASAGPLTRELEHPLEC